ncbi:MAG TPA: alternative ribosome rescue aminoacyl-tRNA hydrolase ArfB [Rhizomicrobium sp.]|jgi:ribosome-associated protein|nr:alternative ribosome rescue aminoacyl-tRNA hydrolase ArfB [Rhizomicrobium sp.]
MTRIAITPALSIDDSELDESFILASGPGGQNVNKVASAVQLRFDAARSPSLPESVRAKLLRLAGRKRTNAGEIVILARRSRSQEQNRAEARDRLVALLREAATPDIPRRRTRPPRASRKARLDAKRAQSARKRLRARPSEE